MLTAVFVWSWEKGVSPFTFLRNMGPWGPMFAARYTQRRFAAQSEEDRQDIHSYIYNTSILKGSGEFCICESHTSDKSHGQADAQRTCSRRARTPGYQSWTV